MKKHKLKCEKFERMFGDVIKSKSQHLFSMCSYDVDDCSSRSGFVYTLSEGLMGMRDTLNRIAEEYSNVEISGGDLVWVFDNVWVCLYDKSL